MLSSYSSPIVCCSPSKVLLFVALSLSPVVCCLLLKSCFICSPHTFCQHFVCYNTSNSYVMWKYVFSSKLGPPVSVGARLWGVSGHVLPPPLRSPPPPNVSVWSKGGNQQMGRNQHRPWEEIYLGTGKWAP